MNGSEWRSVAISFEGDAVEVLGLNPWAFDWERVPETDAVEVRHPSYLHQKHKAWRYRVHGPTGWVEFAAGELSNGVWGFYVEGPRQGWS